MATQQLQNHKQEVPGFRTELKERWPLILVLFMMQVFAFGFPTFALPFVYSGATEEFGWTRQQAVLLASFKFYVSAFAALAVGRILDSINPKWVVALSAAVGALAMAGFVLANTLPIYYGLGILLGLTAAGMAVAVNVIVSRVFEKTTGRILGIVLAGTSAAGMLLPLAFVPLMKMAGWRDAMAILSCCIWLVALPAWLLLSRKGSPLDKRLREGSFSAARTGMWDHFRELAATRDFWFIFIGAFLVSAVDQSVVQNQVLFLKSEKKLSLDIVGAGSALLAGIGIVAKIFFGWVYDRLSIIGIVFCYLLLAVSIGLAFTVTGVLTMFLFVMMVGIGHGGLIVNGPVLLKHRYGPRNLGLNMGIFTLCASLGFGFGPPLMARMADKSGSYSGAFALGIAAIAVAAVLLYPVKPKFWNR
jgi:OFA family oxalate/formate antiporter-like MFS transporter